jgi:hypothetical protein
MGPSIVHGTHVRWDRSPVACPADVDCMLTDTVDSHLLWVSIHRGSRLTHTKVLSPALFTCSNARTTHTISSPRRAIPLNSSIVRSSLSKNFWTTPDDSACSFDAERWCCSSALKPVFAGLRFLGGTNVQATRPERCCVFRSAVPGRVHSHASRRDEGEEIISGALDGQVMVGTRKRRNMDFMTNIRIALTRVCIVKMKQSQEKTQDH